MQDLNLQPKMVGRENELKELKAYLDKAADGEGNTIFISGEAGIGKTRLVEEFKQIAQERGFQILSGNCMYESLTPFMPMMEALRSGGLESLFAEEAPKVEAVYLITHSGLLIKDVVRQETKLDPDLFSSVVTTLSEFASQSLSNLLGEEQEGTLNSIGFKNYRILIESRKNLNLVVIISGKENEFLINDMRDIFSNVNKSYADLLEDWNGNEENVKGIEKFLEPLIRSGKYDGIYYGKDDPKIRRNLLFENVSLGLMRQARQTPTLLCIEDLHWVDPSTLALIHYIARNVREYGLIILSTYRPEEVDAVEGKGHPLLGTMQVMDREDLYEKIELGRLPEGSMDEFLFALLGKFDFTDEFKDRIYKETEGNPFFVIQLIRYMIDEKIIFEDEGTWKLTKDLKDFEIPPKIYNVIERRLNRLDKEDRKILDYASVIGETFISSIISAALDTDKTQLLEQLRDLEQIHRLVRSPNGNFKFDHVKIKEVLYSEIPEELRMDYHSIIANSIETLNKDNLDGAIGDLAYHYYRCKNKEKALPYLIKAAEKAKMDYSNEEAVMLYNKALEFMENKQKKMEIFDIMGDISFLIGDYDKSIEMYECALKLTEEKKKMAEIKAKIGGIYYRNIDYEKALEICTEALDLVKDEKCMEEAFVINHIGSIHWLIGEYDKALKHHEKCLEISENIDDQLGIAQSLFNIGDIHFWRDEYDRALEFQRKSLEISKKNDDMYGMGYCLSGLGYTYLHMGDYDGALKCYEKSLEINEKIGSLRMRAYSYRGGAEVYLKKKDLKNAKDYCSRALDLSEKVGDKDGIALSMRIFALVYREQKKWKESIESFEKAIKNISVIQDEMIISPTLYELGLTHYDFGLMWKVKGDIDKAREHFQKALNIFEELKIEKKMEKVKAVLGDL